MMAQDVTIEDAFEVLQVAIEEAISAVQDSGSDAMRHGDFDGAEHALRQARKLDEVRGQLADLRSNFEEHVIVEVEPESSHSRLRHGLRTHEDEYRVPILEALVEMGGRGNLNEVLSRVYEKMKHQLNNYDHEPLPSDSSIPRWRNTAQWTRNTLRSEGLLRGDSPRGIWEISDEGREWLEE